jgi:mono/diheme cytochrome c family protein
VKNKSSVHGFWMALAFSLFCMMLAASANNGNSKDKGKDSSAATSAASHTAQDDTMRLEGEKRFHSNCARCHAAPPKFAPRVTATIIRHMRVRATITEEEARLILHYMAQ